MCIHVYASLVLPRFFVAIAPLNDNGGGEALYRSFAIAQDDTRIRELESVYPSSSSSSAGLVYFTFTLLKVKDERAFESATPGRKLILARLMRSVV